MKTPRINSNWLRALTAVATLFLITSLAPQRAQAAATASDSACNDSTITSGGNGGSGFNAWTGVASGAGYYAAGGITGDSCSNASWGMYYSSDTTASAERPFTNNTGALSVGQTITADMANGGVNSGGSEGMSIYNSSGNPVWEMYFSGNGNYWNIHDFSGNTNSDDIPYEGEPAGVRVLFTLTTPTNYSLTVQAPIGTSHGPFTGQLINAIGGTNITQLRFYDYDNGGSGHNLEVGQIGVSCPTPTFTTQPISNFVFSGSSGTFTVATTAASPSYQWQTNNGSGFVNIGSATSASYTTPATTTAMNGLLYRCVVTDACGDTTNSAAAMLTVSSSTTPVVTAGPTNVTVCSGNTANFAVTATGSSLSYDWYQYANSGWGSAWTVTNETGGTIFLGNSTNTLGTTVSCGSFGPYGNINTASTNSWGLYGGTTGEQVTRTFPAALTNRQVFQINMCNGNVDTNLSVGFSLHNSANVNLLSFFFTGGGTQYGYTDATGSHLTSVGYTRQGLQVTVIVGAGSPATYTLLITPCGGSPVGYTGTFASTNDPDIILLFNNNNTGTDTSISDCYWNSLFAGAAFDDADNYTSFGNYSGHDAGEASAISGATSASYTTPATTTSMNGNRYYAMAYNSVGAAVSTNDATLTVNALPSATIADSPGSDCQGSAETFSVPAASGYSWSLSANSSGASISGGTNASSVNVNNGGTGSYTVNVTVTNATGCTSNSSLTVTTVAAPTVSNPSNTTVCQGSTASFSITGTGVSTYQWLVNNGSGFVDVNGGANNGSDGTNGLTANFTTVSATSGMNNYLYECIVTGCGGAMATSQVATLTVSPTSEAGTVSASASSLCTGNSVTLTDSGSVGTIQWYTATNAGGFSAISGATTTNLGPLTLSDSTSSNIIYYYYAVVTSGACSAANTTTNAITVSPTSVGGTASAALPNLLSGLTDTITLSGYTGTIQWQGSVNDVNFTNISSATSATYATPALTQTTYYQAVVTSGACSSNISTVATVTVSTAPVITAGPTNATVCSGSPATFAVTASGSSLSYAWYSHTNAGWGSAWSASGGGGVFLGSSAVNNNGAANCNTFSGNGDINTSSGNAWGLYGGSGGESAVRAFPAVLTSGQIFQINMDNGGVDSSPSQQNGFSLQNSSGTFLFSFYFQGGASDYSYADGNGVHTTSVGYTVNGLQVTVIVGAGTSYTLLITPCGGSTVEYTGAFSTTGGPGKVVLFNNNQEGGDNNNLYFNSLIAGQAFDDADNYSGNWSSVDAGDTTPISGATSSSYSFTATNGATYYAMAYNSLGAAVSTNATLTVNPLPTVTIAPGSTNICSGGSATLTATTSASSPSYVWSDSETTPSITVSPASTTSYTVTVTDGTTGCANTSAGATVTVNPLPTVTISPSSTNICSGSSATLTASTSASSPTYLWSDSETTPSITVSPASTTSYTVTVTDGTTGCANTSASATVTVTVCQTSSSLTVGSSENPSGFNTSVSFTAGVTPTNATGSVVFLTNGVTFDTEGLSSGSATSAATTLLPPRTNLITAEYSGDSNYFPSTNTLNQVVTEPLATPMTVQRTAGLQVLITLSDLATNWSDAVSGTTVELMGIGPVTTNNVTLMLLNVTTNLDGSYVITNDAYIGYTNSPNVNDQFSYSLRDEYGATNTGIVNIVIVTNVTGNSSITSIVSGNPTTLTAYGIQGYTYVTQRATNLVSAVWVNIATNTAATNGVISVTDNFSDLGGQQPANAYYRLSWSPSP